MDDQITSIIVISCMIRLHKLFDFHVWIRLHKLFDFHGRSDYTNYLIFMDDQITQII
jgi:hypothetical protein